MAQQFNVALAGGAAPQLPTLILFERGREAARIPAVFEDGSVAKTRPFLKASSSSVNQGSVSFCS